jgi:hypothetical protein
MAAVPIVITGLAVDDTGRSVNMTITGIASSPGLTAGHPLPEPPPGIWPSPGHPAHPIVIPPGGGGGIGIWPSPGHPSHPIVLPPIHIEHPIPPIPTHPIVIPQPPPEIGGRPPEGVKPPPDDGGWAYIPQWGWGYFPTGSEPGPKD